MTSYIVHYSDGGPDMMRTVSPPSTTTDITGLTNGDYTISVEATSLHLSGESGEMTITLRMFKLHVVYMNELVLFQLI